MRLASFSDTIYKATVIVVAASVGPATVKTASAKEDSSIGHRFRIGGFLGGAYLSDENELGNSVHPDQVPGSGALFGLRLGYMLVEAIAPTSDIDPHLWLEAEARTAISSTDSNADGGRSSELSPVIGWRLNAVLDLNTHNPFSQFILAGMGGETVVGDSKFMHSPDTDLAWYVGAGAKYEISKKVALRGDLRGGFTAGRDDLMAPLVEAHLGAEVRFGAPPSAITPTVVPVYPEAQEPKIDLDPDNDGVLGDKDSCPKLPEVMNGIDDEDGCPEVDSDDDGLLGSLDDCPAAAEDRDGFEDEDGCPDPDNDKDGRPDVIDSCPTEPETMNGFEDEDGCPDEIPVQVKKFTGTIKGIKFRRNSARILRNSHKTLDAAYEVLQKHPSVRIEISGHTDFTGKSDHNRDLSRKRADYVKWYLVDKGIKAERIVTVGYGPDRPIGDNDTKAGRRLNRRIEFRLLPGPAEVSAEKNAAPESAPTPPSDPK